MKKNIFALFVILAFVLTSACSAQNNEETTEDTVADTTSEAIENTAKESEVTTTEIAVEDTDISEITSTAKDSEATTTEVVAEDTDITEITSTAKDSEATTTEIAAEVTDISEVTTDDYPFVPLIDTPVSEQRFEELCGMLYYHDKQIKIPCCVEDILAVDENLTAPRMDFEGWYYSSKDLPEDFDSSEYYRKKLGFIYLGDTRVFSISADDVDGDIFTVSDEYECIFLSAYTDDFNLFNGEVTVGMTYDEIQKYFEGDNNGDRFCYNYTCGKKLLRVSFLSDLLFDENGRLTKLPGITYCSDTDIGPNLG